MNLKWLVFGLTEEQIRGAVIVLWRGGVVVTALWIVGAFQNQGFPGFARADEVDQKIEKAIEPIKKELSEQRTILDTVSEQLTATLAESKAAEIRHLVSRRCKETDPREKDRINKEVDRKQEEYVKLRGQRYVISCGEV